MKTLLLALLLSTPAFADNIWLRTAVESPSEVSPWVQEAGVGEVWEFPEPFAPSEQKDLQVSGNWETFLRWVMDGNYWDEGRA